MSLVRLKDYDNSWYHPGAPVWKRALWVFFGEPCFSSRWLPGSGARSRLLRIFGARIGSRVVIKPGVRVKYPWHLEVGDDCWIGEESWIDNLTTVRLGANTCVSQGAYLCTGNHDWTDPRFGLRVSHIELGEGSWAGARSVLMPGTILGSYAIAAAGSVVRGRVPDFEIHAGNPAQFVRRREIKEDVTTPRAEGAVS